MNPVMEKILFDEEAPARWIIDRDLYSETYGDPTGKNRAGTRGSREWEEGDEERCTTRFRVKDEDGEIFYLGWLLDDDQAVSQSAALRFGEADVGVTAIEVWRYGRWVQDIG